MNGGTLPKLGTPIESIHLLIFFQYTHFKLTAINHFKLIILIWFLEAFQTMNMLHRIERSKYAKIPSPQSAAEPQLQPICISATDNPYLVPKLQHILKCTSSVPVDCKHCSAIFCCISACMVQKLLQ